MEFLGFLSGDWVAEMDGGVFEESWSTVGGDSMVGHGRWIVAGTTRFMEFMSIERTGGGVSMFIVLGALSRGEKIPVEFGLVESGDGFAVFARNGEDFPCSIRYERTDAGLLCRLSGIGVDPQVKVYDFRTRPQEL